MYGKKTVVNFLFMADGAAFHRDLEMEERIEIDFSVTGKINFGVSAEILTVLIHFFNFRQQNLTQYLTNGYWDINVRN